ncbi:hypothetical protein B0H13DRAFT_1856276 [Mycena leptocephala]|nr:hypothetical protein B0H13DRAFT_1856276 [Mycena leptocephala]
MGDVQLMRTASDDMLKASGGEAPPPIHSCDPELLPRVPMVLWPQDWYNQIQQEGAQMVSIRQGDIQDDAVIQYVSMRSTKPRPAKRGRGGMPAGRGGQRGRGGGFAPDYHTRSPPYHWGAPFIAMPRGSGAAPSGKGGLQDSIHAPNAAGGFGLSFPESHSIPNTFTQPHINPSCSIFGGGPSPGSSLHMPPVHQSTPTPPLAWGYPSGSASGAHLHTTHQPQRHGPRIHPATPPAPSNYPPQAHIPPLTYASYPLASSSQFPPPLSTYTNDDYFLPGMGTGHAV